MFNIGNNIMVFSADIQYCINNTSAVHAPTKISLQVNWPQIIDDNWLIGTSKIQSYNKDKEG